MKAGVYFDDDTRENVLRNPENNYKIDKIYSFVKIKKIFTIEQIKLMLTLIDSEIESTQEWFRIEKEYYEEQGDKDFKIMIEDELKDLKKLKEVINGIQ